MGMDTENKKGNVPLALLSFAEQLTKSLEQSTGISGLWDTGKHLVTETVGEIAQEHKGVLGVIGELLGHNANRIMNSVETKKLGEK